MEQSIFNNEYIKQPVLNNESMKHAFISDLESNRNHEIQVFADSFNDLQERLKWLESKYSKHITYFEYETGKKQPKKATLYRNGKIVSQKNSETFGKIDKFTFYAYYEYQRTKDLILLEKIINKASEYDNITEKKQYLIKKMFDNELLSKLKYFSKHLFKQMIDKELKIINTLKNEYTDQNTLKNKIKWRIKKTELVELVTALIESNKVLGQKKDIYDILLKTFNIEYNKEKYKEFPYNKLFNDIENRYEKTKFLDNLRTNLRTKINKRLNS